MLSSLLIRIIASIHWILARFLGYLFGRIIFVGCFRGSKKNWNDWSFCFRWIASPIRIKRGSIIDKNFASILPFVCPQIYNISSSNRIIRTKGLPKVVDYTKKIKNLSKTMRLNDKMLTIAGFWRKLRGYLLLFFSTILSFRLKFDQVKF